MEDVVVFINLCIIFLILFPIFLLIAIFGKKKHFFYLSFGALGLAIISFLLVIIFANVPTPNLLF
ncbi:hypothetical protein [Fusobacterium sp. PH5-44]|uniref:hypothetical protein n=1 Tax=unclassified Fusobacterium TaxID=2648384 RepID=UPI003D21116E